MISPTRIHQEQIIEAPSQQVVLGHQFVNTLEANTTPSVLNVQLFECSGATVTITNFINGQHGQSISILGDGLTTVEFNANIKTSTGVDRLLDAGKIFRFTNYNGVWYEDNNSALTASGDLPVHDHDDRYYTETEINNFLASKANAFGQGARADIAYTTVNFLDNYDTEISTHTGIQLGVANRPASGMIFKVTVDRASRIRLYSDFTSAGVDFPRSSAVEPTPGNGLLMDFVFTPSLLSIVCSPIPIFVSLESDGLVDYLIQNRSGSNSKVTVTFTRILTEN